MTPTSPDIQYRALLQRAIELRDFLDGAYTLDGVWFGERHPNESGAFWWRKHMRAVIDEIAATLSPPQATQQAVQVTREWWLTIGRTVTCVHATKEDAELHLSRCARHFSDALSDIELVHVIDAQPPQDERSVSPALGRELPFTERHR